MTSVGATSYRYYGFYASINDDDGDGDGILSDDLPLLPQDDNDDFIFEPVCVGTNFYPTNGIAPTCDFDMDKYMEYYANPDTYPGDFDELVSNCTGCSRCRSGTCEWRLAVGAYYQQGCYQYQNVPGNYCPFILNGSYRCGAGYYGTPTYSSGQYSGCHACMSLAQAGLTVISNPSSITTLTSLAGSTDATACYADSGDADTRVVLNDGRGNFYWDNDGYGTCYYSAQ